MKMLFVWIYSKRGMTRLGIWPNTKTTIKGNNAHKKEIGCWDQRTWKANKEWNKMAWPKIFAVPFFGPHNCGCAHCADKSFPHIFLTVINMLAD